MRACNITIYFIYDPQGRVIAEYEDESLTKEFVYGNGFNEVLAMFLPQNEGNPADWDAFIEFVESWLCADPNDACYNAAYDHNSDDIVNYADFAHFAGVWDMPSNQESNWYYLHDALGSIRGLIGGRFNRESDREFYNYDVYGKSSDVSAVGNPFRFAGYYFDTETGLCHTDNRTYDPETGRWLQIDPLGINPAGGKGNPFSIEKMYFDSKNLYEYVQSNPILFVDPSGLRRYEIACSPVEEGGEWWRPILRKANILHCELHDVGLSAPGDIIYPVRRTLSGYLRKGSKTGIKCKCARREDIEECVRAVRKEFAWGSYYPNCHTQTKAILKYCCLTSNWKPPIVSGNVPDIAVRVKKCEDGKCTH